VELFQGIETRFDFRGVDGWGEQTAAQKASAHAGAGAIEDVEERRFFRFAGEEGFDEFKIADSGRVEDERVGAIVKSGAFEMIERGALGFAEIVKDGGGGSGGERTIFEAATVEREEMEMIAKTARCVIGAEDPGLDGGL